MRAVGNLLAAAFWITLTVVIVRGYVEQRRDEAELRRYDRRMAAREALRRIDRSHR